MTSDRFVRILVKVFSGDGPGVVRVCEVCADVAAMSGASIMLMSGDLPGASASTNEVSARIEELHYTLGDYHQDRPVLEPDLADPATPRWFAFTPPAVEAGTRAIFGFPLPVGTIRLGALTLYRDWPGPLSDDQHADARVLADVAAQSILALQAQAPPGALAAGLDDGAIFRPVAHQASGIVAAQLGISVGDALLRLRAYAFANDRPLIEVAEEAVDHRLRLD